MTTTRTIIAAQPEFEVIVAPSPVKWPVVAWCIEDNGESMKAVPITTDNEINFRVDRGDCYALCHPNGTCSFPDGECVPNAAAAERLCEQDAMKVTS